MKAFEVEWNDEATQMLVDVYLNASDPTAIRPAQHRVDRRLEQRPRIAGFELAEGLWLVIEPPLKIFYEIDEAKRVVTITHVQLI
jgi:hypothetical protein